MAITKDELLTERKDLETDFNSLQTKIKQFEKDVVQMKGNLNAVYGAIQQVDKLLKKFNTDEKKDEKQLLNEKETALNIV